MYPYKDEVILKKNLLVVIFCHLNSKF